MATILVVRSGSERVLALALKDLERRFAGASVVLLSDPDLSPTTLQSHSSLRLVKYRNLRRFTASQLIQLCRPTYHVKAILLTGETESRYAKFKFLFFLFFRARTVIAFNENGDSFEFAFKNWKIITNHIANRLSHSQGPGIGKGIGGLLRVIIGLIALPIAITRLALSIAFVFVRKWVFSIFDKDRYAHTDMDVLRRS